MESTHGMRKRDIGKVIGTREGMFCRYDRPGVIFARPASMSRLGSRIQYCYDSVIQHAFLALCHDINISHSLPTVLWWHLKTRGGNWGQSEAQDCALILQIWSEILFIFQLLKYCPKCLQRPLAREDTPMLVQCAYGSIREIWGDGFIDSSVSECHDEAPIVSRVLIGSDWRDWASRPSLQFQKHIALSRPRSKFPEEMCRVSLVITRYQSLALSDLIDTRMWRLRWQMHINSFWWTNAALFISIWPHQTDGSFDFSSANPWKKDLSDGAEMEN